MGITPHLRFSDLGRRIRDQQHFSRLRGESDDREQPSDVQSIQQVGRVEQEDKLAVPLTVGDREACDL